MRSSFRLLLLLGSPRFFLWDKNVVFNVILLHSSHLLFLAWTGLLFWFLWRGFAVVEWPEAPPLQAAAGIHMAHLRVQTDLLQESATIIIL